METNFKMKENIKPQLLYKITNTNSVFLTTWEHLKKLNIKNWGKNRPPDICRIPQICEQLKKQTYIDGIIYIFKNKNKEWICYDGIHRLTALYTLDSQATLNKHNEKTNNYNIIVDVVNVYNELYISHKFKKINMCVPVPELYTAAEQELTLRNNIENTCNYFQTKYKVHFSPNKNSNKPNENRDAMIQKLTEYFKEIENNNLTDEKMIGIINDFNNKMKDSYHIKKSKITKRMKDKCEKTGCYLFIYKNWICYL